MTDWYAILLEIKGNRAQEALAKDLELSQAHISRLLTRKREITMEIKRRIAEKHPQYLSLFLQEAIPFSQERITNKQTR